MGEHVGEPNHSASPQQCPQQVPVPVPRLLSLPLLHSALTGPSRCRVQTRGLLSPPGSKRAPATGLAVITRVSCRNTEDKERRGAEEMKELALPSCWPLLCCPLPFPGENSGGAVIALTHLDEPLNSLCLAACACCHCNAWFERRLSGPKRVFEAKQSGIL